MNLTELLTPDGVAYVNLEEFATLYPKAKNNTDNCRMLLLRGGNSWVEVLDEEENISNILGIVKALAINGSRR